MNEDTVTPLTPQMLEALAGLRELHFGKLTTQGVDALLPGVVLALLLLGAAVFLFWRTRPRQRRLRRLARAHQRWADDGNTVHWARSLAQLLREASAGTAPTLRRHRRRRRPGDAVGGAVARAESDALAGQVGETWLAWLDARAPEADRGAFVSGVGRLLAEAPFAPPETLHLDTARAEAVRALVERWLRARG